MKSIQLTYAVVIASLVVGCSSSDKKTPDTTNEGTPDSGEAAPSATTIAAPTIDEVVKMTGSLHVMWTNKEAACDAIEGERQAEMSDGSIMEKYKVVFAEPGEADNKHDTSATDDMKYSYRLRCKKGAAYSDYSNVMSANPVE